MPTKRVGQACLDNPYLFTGRITDTLHAHDLLVSEDSNFRRIQDNRNRMYDPKHGRWLQRDPLGVRPDPPAGSIEALKQYTDGMNLYESVGGSPCVRTDPTGTDYNTRCKCQDWKRQGQNPGNVTAEECCQEWVKKTYGDRSGAGAKVLECMQQVADGKIPWDFSDECPPPASPSPAPSPPSHPRPTPKPPPSRPPYKCKCPKGRTKVTFLNMMSPELNHWPEAKGLWYDCIPVTQVRGTGPPPPGNYLVHKCCKDCNGAWAQTLLFDKPPDNPHARYRTCRYIQKDHRRKDWICPRKFKCPKCYTKRGTVCPRR